MKYRKLPVVIEAEFVGDLLSMAKNDWKALPDYIVKAYDEGKILFGRDHIVIETLEGEMHVSEEDLIIQGVKGELYPCKYDIFQETYTPLPHTPEVED